MAVGSLTLLVLIELLHLLLNTESVPIYNGEIAEKRQFPFAVSFGFQAENSSSFQHFCGGSIIENDFKFSWAITAAHCFSKFKQHKVHAIIGSDDLLRSPEDSCIVLDVFMDDYKMYNLQNDIALVKIECQSHKYQQVIDMSPIEPARDLECLIYGYGSLNYDIHNGKPSNKLYYGTVEVINLDECEEFVGRAIVPMPDIGQFCGHGKEPRPTDACSGDSGSGLICRHSKTSEYKIFGIISYGTGCGSNSAGIYESVAFHRHWIESTLQNECQIGEGE